MKIEVDKGLLKSLLILGAVIEARDAYTGGHTWRIAQFSTKLAKRYGLSRSEIFVTYLGGFVHDIGKVGIPDRILNKPGALTDEEFSIIKTHTKTGHNIVSEHPLAALVLGAVSHHHERVDGRGYPEGLQNQGLTIYSKIISIADSFDAMTSTRPYRQKVTKREGYLNIKKREGRPV